MLKLKPTLILVLSCVLIRSEAEGAIRKRWIQPLAFGQEPHTKREAQRQEDESILPKFPGEDDEFGAEVADAQSQSQDQSQTQDDQTAEQSAQVQEDDQQSQSSGQVIEPEARDSSEDFSASKSKSQEYGFGFGDTTIEPSYYTTTEAYFPWYKKVGRFFKKHYHNLKNSIRGSRNQYTTPDDYYTK